jgi:hypothetical protein
MLLPSASGRQLVKQTADVIILLRIEPQHHKLDVTPIIDGDHQRRPTDQADNLRLDLAIPKATFEYCRFSYCSCCSTVRMILCEATSNGCGNPHRHEQTKPLFAS